MHQSRIVRREKWYSRKQQIANHRRIKSRVHSPQRHLRYQDQSQRVELRRGVHPQAARRHPRRHTVFTSIGCWSRSTRRQEFPRDQWASWIHSSTMYSPESVRSQENWSITTRSIPYQAERSRPLSDCCCQVNWPSMQWVRAPRQSPNTVLKQDSDKYIMHKLTYFKLK